MIGAGNRSQDQAITRPLSSALVNRLLHVQQRASARDWPEAPEERDVLYFLVQQLRDRLIRELPDDERKAGSEARQLANRVKELLVPLSRISTELAQLVVTETESGAALPAWYTVELARALPKLAAKK